MKPIRSLIVIAVLVFVLSACVSEVSRTTTPPTLAPSNTPIPRPEPTAKPISPPTAIPAPTNTPAPAIATAIAPVPTPIPTSIPTPIPTPEPTRLPKRDNSEVPHVFVGEITIGGSQAPDGTKVTVWLPEFDGPIGSGTSTGGNYSVLAHQHGSQSFGGRFLIFKIDGQNSEGTAIWEKGGATILNLSLN